MGVTTFCLAALGYVLILLGGGLSVEFRALAWSAPNVPRCAVLRRLIPPTA
jgi:hypothetical protein